MSQEPEDNGGETEEGVWNYVLPLEVLIEHPMHAIIEYEHVLWHILDLYAHIQDTLPY